MSSNPRLYHPGTCEATEFGKRYGKNLGRKSFDDPGHQWHLAKDKNWGPWSCCGKSVNSPGCQVRDLVPRSQCSSDYSIPLQEQKHLQFIGAGDVCRVVAEEQKCWRLEGGRVAKKKTEGIKWNWVEQKESTNSSKLC